MSVTVLGLVGGVLGGDNDDRASTASTTQPRVDGVDPVETFFFAPSVLQAASRFSLNFAK